jgi:RNA polymerase I-specific transcription initiation factor RRN3
LALITDRIVKIDVQVQVDIDDLAEDIGEDILEAIPRNMEDLIDESDGEESSDESDIEDDELEIGTQRAKVILENIEKLDIILDIMFKHYTDLFANPSTQFAALDTLLSHFKSTILPTYQSRHTQFLLFHFAQRSSDLVDIFIGTLLGIADDKSRASIVRGAAVAYAASFIARGLHVTTSEVRRAFTYISTQLSQLLTLHAPDCRGPDPRRYSMYYALCQALLYIFCFRWRDLKVSAEDSYTPSPRAMLYDDDGVEQHPTFLPNVKETLFKHIHSPLNPLKVCSPIIVNEFARITEQLGLLFLSSKLESNKRVRLVTSALVDHRETALTGRQEHMQCLDAYFPFDPYRLPRSKHWVENDYREWSTISGLDDMGNGSDSGRDHDEESDGDSEDTETGDEEE